MTVALLSASQRMKHRKRQLILACSNQSLWIMSLISRNWEQINPLKMTPMPLFRICNRKPRNQGLDHPQEKGAILNGNPIRIKI